MLHGHGCVPAGWGCAQQPLQGWNKPGINQQGMGTNTRIQNSDWRQEGLGFAVVSEELKGAVGSSAVGEKHGKEQGCTHSLVTPRKAQPSLGKKAPELGVFLSPWAALSPKQSSFSRAHFCTDTELQSLSLASGHGSCRGISPELGKSSLGIVGEVRSCRSSCRHHEDKARLLSQLQENQQ